MRLNIWYNTKKGIGDKMRFESTLEEIDLSVRSFNCLKRAGIHSIEDIVQKLNEGWDSFGRIRNLGRKSACEIIKKIKQLGYDTEKIENEIADWLKNQILSDESKLEWNTLLEELKNVEIVKYQNQKVIEQNGTPLSVLIDVSYNTLKRLNDKSIFTIEALMEQYKNASELPFRRYLKWELLKALDVAGYRFDDCNMEEFPDIKDYIYLDKIISFNIDDLEISEEIKDIIDYQNLDMLSIIKSSIETLNEYFSKPQIVELLTGMEEQGIRLQICDSQTEVKDFVAQNIEMPVNEFLESKVTCSNLQKKEITTINQLISYTRTELRENKIVGDMALQGIIETIKKYKLYLKGDVTYKCDKCGDEFIAAEEHTSKHYCELCKEKEKRVKKVKEVTVSIKGPDYGSYTNGSTGFTLFATISNNSSKFEEISLKGFFVYHKNRQWASTSYLTGYKFETEHIMPKSSLTAGKIWSGYEWIAEKLVDGDYISLYLGTKEKNYTFKFVLKNTQFILDDYFVN